jgi:hypothetical protein
MTISRYLAIPLLAATSLAVSLMLLPIEPAGARAQGNASVAPMATKAG